MKYEGFIITISNFSKNKTAKLKGDAFELFVGWTLKLMEGNSMRSKKQQTIKKVIDDYGKRYCFVNRKFDLIFGDNIIESYNTDPDKGQTIFDKDSLMTYSGLKLCYKTKKQNKEIKFNERGEFIKYLIDNGFISNVTSPTIFRKFRLDYCRTKNGRIYFLECKNKEKTYLEKRDINQIISYGMILREAVPLGWIETIVNGDLEFEKILYSHGLEIRLWDIKDWLIRFGEKTGLKIDCLVFSKIRLKAHGISAIMAGKKSESYLNIHTFPYNQSDDYKPFPLIVSNNIEFIKKHLQ